MEYIYGKNTIDSFLESNLLQEVYIQNTFKDEKILQKLRQKKIKVFVKNKEFFDKIAKDSRHQGIVGAIRSFEYTPFERMIKKCQGCRKPLLVLLDGIEDPHNFGAIIRSCEAFSVDGIIVSKHASCPLNATVAKVSTGTIANMDIAQVNNLTQTLKELKKMGYWIYAAEANQGVDYKTLSYDGPSVLVVGSEGFGISRLIKEQADFNVFIPMTGKVNSLNVSVATAILVSEMARNK